MKKLYLFSGLAVLIISTFIFVENLKVNQVHENGTVVKAKIVEMSSSCRGTKNKYIKVSYLDRLYSIRIKTPYCESHQIGDIIDIKRLPGYERVVLPEEPMKNDLLFNIVLIVIGAIVVLVGIRKK